MSYSRINKLKRKEVFKKIAEPFTYLIRTSYGSSHGMIYIVYIYCLFIDKKPPNCQDWDNKQLLWFKNN